MREHKNCSCDGTSKLLTQQEIVQRMAGIPGWTLATDGRSIAREYVKKDFMDAVIFINEVGRIAEFQGHHPDIHLTAYRNVRIELSTHSLKGLSENDFIVAAKINELPRPVIAK